jgi:hypothetical protein
MRGYDMDGNGCLDPSSTDFEQMIMQLRQRLRPTPALTLADWLRVYLGLSNATDELREDFPPHDEIAQLPCLDPSVHNRQLRAVLSALLSKASPHPTQSTAWIEQRMIPKKKTA